MTPTVSRLEAWPFPVLPPDQRTAEHRSEIAFLEEASRSGFAPRGDGGLAIEAGTESGRSVALFQRGRDRGGRKRWEVMLTARAHLALHCWADDFDAVAVAALGWLRDRSVGEVLAALDGHVIRGPAIWPDGERARAG